MRDGWVSLPEIDFGDIGDVDGDDLPGKVTVKRDPLLNGARAAQPSYLPYR
jgi:hypothetical protein